MIINQQKCTLHNYEGSNLLGWFRDGQVPAGDGLIYAEHQQCSVIPRASCTRSSDALLLCSSALHHRQLLLNYSLRYHFCCGAGSHNTSITARFCRFNQ